MLNINVKVTHFTKKKPQFLQSIPIRNCEIKIIYITNLL